MTYRVVHCGTGRIGVAGLKGVLNHPDLELVGQYVWSPGKVGVDAGALCGMPDTGVRATNDWDELFALNADCLSYFGDTVGREMQSVQDVCRFLERGTNAVTISVLPWAYPPQMPPEFGKPALEACEKGNSTAFFTGIDPGWATTDLAIAALACADRVDCVRVQEVGWWGSYTAELASREYFGFGKPLDNEPLLITGGFLKHAWGPTLMHIADVLDVEIEDWNVVFESGSVDHDVETGFGIVEAGTASVVYFQLQALSGGRPIAIAEHSDRVARDAGPQFPAPNGPGDLSYRIVVEGSPSYTLELNFDGEDGRLMTAQTAINAIPAVCAATPGLKGPLDLPRYYTRNARRA
ncbi:dihydrodipicolinate reductase [Pseudofrankia sp. DC12]|uniref:NAD(P)H-dependent amine dehydrogenase family protein n=1 Tax=Pseudofrankia sp. DC12 TaxID=683315 RepID=UPI0005F7B1FA|nr:dihydrodipicolinate reductase [Pseudofrankia sp. DC12]